MHRNIHLGLRLGLLAVILSTAALMYWQWTYAWVPAALAAIIYVMAHTIAIIDRHAKIGHLAASAPPGNPPHVTVRNAMERVGVSSALTIIIGIIAIACVLAGITLGWTIVAIGALVVFAFMAFSGLPFWLALVEEEVETERDQLTGTTRSIH